VRTAFVTGGSGFIGGHLIERLVRSHLGYAPVIGREDGLAALRRS
jgi:nucleoside-diphosphate-sugar epimerase